MADRDELLARAEAQRDAWQGKCHKAWDDVDKQANRAITAEMENQRLRAALAARPEPLFEGTPDDVWRWLDQYIDGDPQEHIVVYRIATLRGGSATPEGEGDASDLG
jgi:hypothetical protein